MARKSKSDRTHEIILLNPALKRDDPRISELIEAEALLRKTQRAARNAPVTVATGTGSKRSPELVAVDAANTAVRRLRNDLGIDRVSVKRSEAAGIKVKRSPKAEAILARQGDQYAEHAELIPGLAATWAAYGIVAEDLPEHQQERFRSDVETQADQVQPIRDSLRQAGML